MRPQRRLPSGMTLIEVMIALAIFALAAGGIISASSMAHRTSVDNVANSVALHTAESIMEQIRIMPYEATLLPAFKPPAGVATSPLPIDRYLPETAAGTPAELARQPIPVNTATPVCVEHVTLSTTLNHTGVQVAAADLPLGVRILMDETTTNGATGITVELIYSRYRAITGATTAERTAAMQTATPVSVHTLRTFIPRALQ